MQKVILYAFIAYTSFLSVALADPVTRAIQNSLNFLGYDVGTADGIRGSNTNSGIDEYFQSIEQEVPENDVLLLNQIIENTPLENYEMEALAYLDAHIINSDLLQVELPARTRIILDYDRYRAYRENRYRYNHSMVSRLWTDIGADGRVLDRNRCFEILVNFEAPSAPSETERDLVRCQFYYTTNAIINFEDGINTFGELFWAMASAEDDRWVPVQGDGSNSNPSYYHLPGILAPFITFYSANIDEFDLTDDQHIIIQRFFTEKAFAQRFDLDGDGRDQPCPILNPLDLSESVHQVNNCGTVRLRFAAAELTLATVTQNQTMWAKGLWDLDFTLSMIDHQGFFVPTSAKGCLALGYLWDTSKLFSINVEILKIAGFDLLEYETRHGVQVHEAYDQLLRQYDDVTISNHIASKGIGAAMCGRTPYDTHDEFLIRELGNLRHPQIPSDARISNWATHYILNYRPDTIQDLGYEDIEADHFMGTGYFTITPFEIFNANLEVLPTQARDSFVSMDFTNTRNSSDWFWSKVSNADFENFNVLEAALTSQRFDAYNRVRNRISLVVIDTQNDSEFFNGNVTFVEDSNGLHKLTIDLQFFIDRSPEFASAWSEVVGSCDGLDTPDQFTLDIPVDYREYSFEMTAECLERVADESAGEIYRGILFIAKYLNDRIDDIISGSEETQGIDTSNPSREKTTWFNQYYLQSTNSGLYLGSYTINRSYIIRRNGNRKYEIWSEVRNDDDNLIYFGTLEYFERDNGELVLGLEMDRLRWENPEFYNYWQQAKARCEDDHFFDGDMLDIPINYDDELWQALVDCVVEYPMSRSVRQQFDAWIQAAGSIVLN